METVFANDLYCYFSYFMKQSKLVVVWSKNMKNINLALSKRKKSSWSAIRYNHLKISSPNKKNCPYLQFPWKKSSYFYLIYELFKTLNLRLYKYSEKKTVNPCTGRSNGWFC